MENKNDDNFTIIKDFSTFIQNKIATTEQLIEMQITKKEENRKNCIIDLKYYSYDEKLFLEEINKRYPQIDKKTTKILKKQIFYILKEKFLQSEKRGEIRNLFQNNLETFFYKYIIPNLDFSEEIFKFSQNEINNQDNKEEMKKFRKELIQTEIEKTSVSILEQLKINNDKNLDKLPIFITKDLSKLINQKLLLQLRINYDIPIKRLQLENDPNYQFLYGRFQDFYDDRINMFDLKYFNNDPQFLECLYKCLYYSNKDYLQYNCNLKVFVNNSKKYLILLGRHTKHSSIVSDCLDNKETVDTVFQELVLKINNNNNTVMFIVFCMSTMLNNICEYVTEGNEFKSVFTPLLKCSAKQKVFLINFLVNLDKYCNTKNKCLYLNVLMENYVFASIVKSYTKVLYDELNKMKIDLTYGKILGLLEKLDKKKKVKSPLEEDHLSEFEFNTLDDIECRNLYELYTDFKNNYIEIEKEKNKEFSSDSKKLLSNIKNGLGSFLTKANKKTQEFFNTNMKKPKIKIKYLNQTLLSPVDPLNSSTQVCICINGFYLNEDFLTYSSLSSSTFSNIINNTNKIAVDYYIYPWQNKDNLYKNKTLPYFLPIDYTKDLSKEIKHNKTVAKLYGQFLAYIICSREIFKFHTISLIGIGLGCKVIKECLKEMNKIHYENDITDLIQNIIFIGGACSIKQKHVDLFRIISEKVVNVYNLEDNSLSFYYNSGAIGTNEITFTNKNKNNDDYLPIIQNYNLTKEINHHNYLLEFNNILTKINFN